MEFRKYVRSAVLALSLLPAGGDLIDTYGPCTPKPDNRPGTKYGQEISNGGEVGSGIGYKQGGCIRNPLEPKRPTRPAFPEEIRDEIVWGGCFIGPWDLHIDNVDEIRRAVDPTYRPGPLQVYLNENVKEEKEINRPENKGEELACIIPCIDGIHIPTPLDPPEPKGPEIVYKQPDDRIPSIKRVVEPNDYAKPEYTIKLTPQPRRMHVVPFDDLPETLEDYLKEDRKKENRPVHVIKGAEGIEIAFGSMRQYI